MATLAVTRRLDLTNKQWARLEPLLPVPTRSGRPSAWTKRQLIDGIRWRVRVGAPWRDVPDCYGSWRAVCGLSIEPDALGRSRGGLTTKIHLACEQGPEGAVPDPAAHRRRPSPHTTRQGPGR